jgi:transposase
VARYRLLCKEAESVTLVFDKGNNAKDTIATIDDSPYHIVGSLVPTQHEDLLAIPLSKLRPLDRAVLPGVRALRLTKVVFKRSFTVVVTHNDALLKAQKRTLEREVKKRLGKLDKVRQSLARWRAGNGRGRQPSVRSVRRRVKKILVGRHMEDLVHVEVGEDEASALPTLRTRFDRRAYRRLEAHFLGRTILFTDHDDWTDEQIVLAYRGQHNVESAFRDMKDTQHLSFRPCFHWSDQTLRVHAFYCVLALLLCSLLRQQLAGKGIHVSARKLLDALDAICEVDTVRSSTGGRPRTERTLSRRSRLQQRIFDALGLARLAQP